MWPFEAKRRRSLAGLSTAVPVDVTATIVSANDVSSPFSEMCAALVWLEVTESMRLSAFEAKELAGSGADLSHFDRDRVLGSAVLGDVLVLRTDDAIDITLCPRRAAVVFARRGGTGSRPESRGRVATSPPELEWLLQKSPGADVHYREIGLLQGARVRLRAVVEPTSHVSSTAYRCAAQASFTVREDAGPVTIEEIPTDDGSGAPARRT